eukprot:CAMPEP_0168617658 /NCGR_PEP_ID=MMETSP0449_2-20121227/5659_1 /TAXON_ID=1082188 /ORGANISM="Strombidium rassoulzadegani, Strain ras09" /LENGTH=44 /DNA_ID= /DNA_START= /DNA_END= /DNA_ORIENTATION=
MAAYFDKNVFFNYEKANSFVKVNNANCKLDIKEIEFQVIQKLRI